MTQPQIDPQQVGQQPTTLHGLGAVGYQHYRAQYPLEHELAIVYALAQNPGSSALIAIGPAKLIPQNTLDPLVAALSELHQTGVASDPVQVCDELAEATSSAVNSKTSKEALAKVTALCMLRLAQLVHQEQTKPKPAPEAEVLAEKLAEKAAKQANGKASKKAGKKTAGRKGSKKK